MKKLFILIFLTGYNFWCAPVWAQCIGVNAGGGNCVPPPGVQNSPLGGGDYNSTIVPRAIIWADRWGAIAVDDTTGQAGAASNQPSRSQAEQIAFSKCSKYGSPHCKIVLWYRNECGASAVGTNVGGGFAAGSTREEAEEKAINACSPRSPDACKIDYSECSLPVRIQ